MDITLRQTRRVELEGVKTSIVGQRGVLLPAIRHPQREGLIQIQLTCVEFPKHGRVTLILEVEVDEEALHNLSVIPVGPGVAPIHAMLALIDQLLKGVKVPARQLLQLKGTISAADSVYKPALLDQKLHADPAMCEESRAGLLLMLGIKPTVSTDPTLPASTDLEQWPRADIRCDKIETAPEAAFKILRATADSWEFNALEFEAATGGNGLVTMALWLFEHQDLVTRLGMDEQKLRLFLQRVQSGYNDNPYHNSTHAMAVLQSLHVILTRGGILEKIEGPYGSPEVLLLAGYLAAIVHDYAHPGVTNDFLVKADSPMAITHNDLSPNENHHLAAAFAMLQDPCLSFMSSASQEVQRLVRRIVIAMVLQTDMKLHMSTITTFTVRQKILESWANSVEDVLLALQTSLKVADMSHLYSNWKVHTTWVGLLEEEMFQQGDLERLKGIPVSPMADRKSNGISAMQVGFFKHVAFGMFEAFVAAFPACCHILDKVQQNAAVWEQSPSVAEEACS
ncbi:hypothetical protein WJX84_006979 [Apatococcus fuscideae]|uniref:Phosphodiesterase n=1 Tax=Apatococcus fuscideae TaxID=2026836 RepID=A0AAW1TDU5_9CHLO